VPTKNGWRAPLRFHNVGGVTSFRRSNTSR
jgi:hypothetical protein